MPRRKVTSTPTPSAAAATKDAGGAKAPPARTGTSASAESDGFTHRVVPAAGLAPPLTTAPSSVFGAAGKTRKPPARVDPIDPGTIAIRKGVPLPRHPRSSGGGTYGVLMSRMAAGDMVELPNTQAKSLYSWATANGIKASTRRLTEGTSGVWRLS